MANTTMAPTNDPISPLGRKASPSPASRLTSRPPTSEPTRPATRVRPSGFVPMPRTSWASQPTMNPNARIPKISTSPASVPGWPPTPPGSGDVRRPVPAAGSRARARDPAARTRRSAVGGRLDGVQLRVLAAPGHELLVATDLDHPRGVEHHDEVGHAHGAEPVGDEDRDAPRGPGQGG